LCVCVCVCVWMCICVLSLLGMQPRVSHMLGKHFMSYSLSHIFLCSSDV
jgi:hypothetical protein